MELKLEGESRAKINFKILNFKAEHFLVFWQYLIANNLY